MAIYTFGFDNRRPGGGGSFGGIGCLIFGVLLLIASYYIIKGLFTVLWWATPVLLIAALVINWRTVAGLGRSYVALLERNPLGGLLLGGLMFLGFPFVALFLFLAALGSKRMETMRQEFEKRMNGTGGFFGEEPAAQEGEYVDFEEIESTPKNMAEPLEPPALPEKESPKKEQNPYDDLFKG